MREKFAIGAVVVGGMRGVGGRRGRVRVRFFFGKWLGFSGLRGIFGFVCDFVAELAEAVEFLDGAAVEAFGLGLIAEELSKGRGFGEEAVEAFGDEVVAVLGAADLKIVVDEDGADGGKGPAVVGDGLIEADCHHAGVEAFGAQESLLGEGDALDGEGLLGIDGLIGCDGVGAEAVDLLDVLEADDWKGGGVENVLAGIPGGSGLALGGAGSGGAFGIAPVGGDVGGGGSWHSGFPIHVYQ